NLVVRELRAEISVGHAVTRYGRADDLVGADGGANRGAVVSGGRLDEDVVDDAGREQAAVGFRVHRHAAGKAQIAAAGQAHALAHDFEDGLLELVLDRRGQV